MLQDDLGDVAWTFEKEISRIPVRNLSVLELKIATRGHFYGAMVLDLLRLCTSIQKLKVELNRYEVVTRDFFFDISNLNLLLWHMLEIATQLETSLHQLTLYT